jgi:hypothetical protein
MDYMRNIEVGGTCGLQGQKCKNAYGLENLKGREYLEV